MNVRRTFMKLQGIYHASSRGFGFLTPDEASGGGQDLFVPPHREGGAWDGDLVSAKDSPDPRDPARRTARITAVLERSNRTVIGAVEKRGREVWMVPGSDRLPHAVKLVGRSRGLRAGDRAAVSMNSFGSALLPPTGTLKAVFGRDGTREASVESILYRYGIEREFPAPVRASAELAPETVEPEAISGRLDLREQTIITIDGAASKDFDDAVSLEKDDQGNWVLGVHIADVSHYVPENSPLDVEAFNRGTSVYFADQVVPMLPEVLSNGICSLNPHVDRLSLSCIMTMDKTGTVLDHKLAKTVIRSTERMTYEDCNVLLDRQQREGAPSLAERYAHILPMLLDMSVLARALEKKRKNRGALDLESRESYIVCDEKGRPVDVRVRETGVSEALIESFMLAANECVAEHLHTSGLPGVYRIHEKPSEDKASHLKAMLAPLGYSLREADNGSLQKVLDAARNTPQAPAIHTMVLRSMMKARYDVQNLGHFGLAAKYYCHFTSPIRRYPDLMVHRILSALLEGRLTKKSSGKFSGSAGRAALQSSERELAAMSAEREIEKCYMAEFMSGHIGDTFPGVISGVTKFGLFVSLANGVEGLLPVTALPDDRYEYDEVRMTLTAPHTGQVYSFGMSLEVICIGANAGSGQIDFVLPGGETLSPDKPSAPAVSPKKSRPTGRKPSGRHGYRPPKRGKGRRRQ